MCPGRFCPDDVAAHQLRVNKSIQKTPRTETCDGYSREGDAQQIELPFQNLLGNTIKHRRQDATLEAGIAAERHGSSFGAMWAFAVLDNEIGFDMAYSDQMFEIFRCLRSGADYEGTGI